MKIIRTIEEWQIERHKINDSLGVVPTMGNLHQGHLSLVQQSQIENQQTLVTIFVNPTQFNDSNDYQNYPKTLEHDLDLLASHQVDYCLLPTKEMLYQDNYQYRVSEHMLSTVMEGESRPGHFTGMLTVVLKLLLLAQADCAYFGEKDYQQYLLIKGMAESFFIPTKISPCPIIRDEHGLALSSRNGRLTASGLATAQQFASIFLSRTDSIEDIKRILTKTLDIEIDYLLEQEDRRYAAVMVEGIRLIDNYQIP